MGKYRSKTGCLTCRGRRVKCDEQRPVCKQCNKKNRSCRWEASGVNIKQYQPAAGSTPSATGMMSAEGGRAEDEEGEQGTMSSGSAQEIDRPGGSSAGADDDQTPSHVAYQTSAGSSYLFSSAAGSSGSTNIAESLFPPTASGSLSPGSSYAPRLPAPVSQVLITRREAALVSHYSEHLGRWLDATDGCRQFTLMIPVLVKQCPPLLHAVLAFAAKHRRDVASAEQAYQQAIGLLIDRLQSQNVVHDDALLCAIVILRFVEQLDVSLTGADSQQHLSGSSAILRASQGPTIDPSAPSLRQAAFWVYVRQCLYTATVNQQPVNIDPTIELSPPPHLFTDQHPSPAMGRETAWANAILWLCARILHFCFDGVEGVNAYDPRARQSKWDELWDAVQRWSNERIDSFDPIWSGPKDETSVFPETFFTADWHTMAFGFYHFSCILLLAYKPGPKFAKRNVGAKLKDADRQILHHARAICGACTCAPMNVGNLITLCHTLFIWGPLMSDQGERDAVLRLLVDLENTHCWPTAWIVNALKEDWDMEG